MSVAQNPRLHTFCPKGKMVKGKDLQTKTIGVNKQSIGTLEEKELYILHPKKPRMRVMSGKRNIAYQNSQNWKPTMNRN